MPEERVNELIRVSPLRVVNADGEMAGVISRDEALELARQQDLDLVEVAPNERPPVCKIMDYGKFKYEQAKKAKKNHAQHHTQLKEIRVRPKVGQADLDVKLKRARGFLEHRDKVMLVMQFRGRENLHQDMGLDVVKNMVEALADISKVEKAPTREGRRITAVLAPR